MVKIGLNMSNKDLAFFKLKAKRWLSNHNMINEYNPSFCPQKLKKLINSLATVMFNIHNQK